MGFVVIRGRPTLSLVFLCTSQLVTACGKILFVGNWGSDEVYVNHLCAWGHPTLSLVFLCTSQLVTACPKIWFVGNWGSDAVYINHLFTAIWWCLVYISKAAGSCISTVTCMYYGFNPELRIPYTVPCVLINVTARHKLLFVGNWGSDVSDRDVLVSRIQSRNLL